MNQGCERNVCFFEKKKTRGDKSLETAPLTEYKFTFVAIQFKIHLSCLRYPHHDENRIKH